MLTFTFVRDRWGGVQLSRGLLITLDPEHSHGDGVVLSPWTLQPVELTNIRSTVWVHHNIYELFGK